MVYSKAVVKKLVQSDAKALDAFCDLIEDIDKFLAAVARYGYKSEKAENAFKEFSGDLGGLEARVTNSGYRRSSKPKAKGKVRDESRTVTKSGSARAKAESNV